MLKILKNKTNAIFCSLFIFFVNNSFSCFCCKKDDDKSIINQENQIEKTNIRKDKDNKDDKKDDNDEEKNDDFILLNCSFKQIYEEDGKEVDYLCCWMISAILAMLNIPKYQKFIKNYKYDGDEKNLNLKIIKDIYEELKDNIGKYDLDFRKYYNQLVEHGCKYYSNIFKKENNKKFFTSSLMDPNILNKIIKYNKDDYFKLNNFNLFFLDFLFLGQNYHFNIDNYKDKYDLIKENTFKRIKHYPGHFAFYKVFNNFNQDFFKWNICYDKKLNLSSLNIAKGFDGKFMQSYLFICEDEKTRDEFNKIYKRFYKITTIKNDSDIFKNIEESNKNLDDLKEDLENYNYELNCIMFCQGHCWTVIKDPKSNKFYSLDSYSTLGHMNGEIKDFYNTFPEELTFNNRPATLYFFTVTKKEK